MNALLCHHTFIGLVGLKRWEKQASPHYSSGSSVTNSRAHKIYVRKPGIVCFLFATIDCNHFEKKGLFRILYHSKIKYPAWLTVVYYPVIRKSPRILAV